MLDIHRNSRFVGVLATVLLFGSKSDAATEKQAVIDGEDYAVVAPIYDGTTGPQSFIRLFNGGDATSTFEITIINSNNGITLGSAAIDVPVNASPQFPVVPASGSNSIFGQAGVATSTGGNYALYIQNTEELSGYVHVTYNPFTVAFENQSLCATPLNQKLAAEDEIVLTNVHTSALASNQFPSILSIHNYADTSQTITIAVSNSATGAAIGQLSESIGANRTLSLSVDEIETELNFSPLSDEVHVNLTFTKPGGGDVPLEINHTVRNSQIDGDVNLTVACAVNPAAATVVEVEPSVPVAYCGTLTYPPPYSSVPVYFTTAVTPSGTMRGTIYGEGLGYIVGGTFSGTVLGTSFTAVSPAGGTASGTIQNGVMSGTFVDVAAGGLVGSLSGSTSSCS